MLTNRQEYFPAAAACFLSDFQELSKKQKSLYFNSGTQLSQKNEIEGFYIIPRKVPVP